MRPDPAPQGAQSVWPLFDQLEREPFTGALVPRFWRPPPGVDLDAHLERLGGEPTILLMISSYRDFQCAETVSDAYLKAMHPERVSVAVVQQTSVADSSCDSPTLSCAAAPEQPLCAHASRVRIFTLDAKNATGPIYARHVGSRMYRGEAFVMQVDAHNLFVRNWDTDVLTQWHATRNEYAVLSTYLTDLQGSLDARGTSLRATRPIMCNSDFKEGGSTVAYMRHGSQPEEVPALREQPMLQPFWGAGFHFSRGHWVVRVPYDCCLPMVFMGEEISMGVRSWSHGYDVYAPTRSVLFHEYAAFSHRRRAVTLFWENDGRQNKGRYEESIRRLTALVELDPSVDPSSFSRQGEAMYGLGHARPASLFYRLFLIDVHGRSTKPICSWVRDGTMHKDFTRHLRADGKGIDYARLADYNTSAHVRLACTDRIWC